MSVVFENSPLLYCVMSDHSLAKRCVVLGKMLSLNQPVTGLSFIWVIAVLPIYLSDEQGVVDQRGVLVDLQTVGWTT